jgi:hypothetical protein
MGRAPVPECVEVVCHRLGAYAFLRGLPGEHVVTVLALGAGGDLQALPQQVEAERQVGPAGRMW